MYGMSLTSHGGVADEHVRHGGKLGYRQAGWAGIGDVASVWLVHTHTFVQDT